MPFKKKSRQDITGNRYGRLVAIEFKHYNDKHHDCWLFRCDCGNEKIMPAANVKWGRVRSCGCLVTEHISSLHRQDISGRKCGRLTAIYPTDKRDASGSVIWECSCECGNTVFCSATCLSRGRTKSCGCLYKETRVTCSDSRTDAVENTLLSILVSSKEPRADNTSGHTGVCYDKRRDVWISYINFQNKRINLGSFKEKEEAICARKDAEARLHDPIILNNWNKLSESTKEKWEAYGNRFPKEKNNTANGCATFESLSLCAIERKAEI